MPNSFIKPKEITIKDMDGNDHTFVISKFPAIDGREIAAKHPFMTGKADDYQLTEDVMLKMMGFVAVIDPSGNKLKLSNKTLVNNHVGDWEVLVKLERDILEYNCSFFTTGSQ